MAAKEFSFDVVSKVDAQELRNAVDQAKRELANRFDFKGSAAEIVFEKDELTLVADDEFKLEQLKQIVESKLVKRSIDLRHLEYGKIEPGTKMTVRQAVKLKQGIEQDTAKKVTKQIRDKGLKVNAQIQGDQLRVSGKDKDELQKTMAFIKGLELEIPVEFTNYR